MRLRHIVFLACVAALLSFSSCAVAEDAGHGGHTNPHAYVNRTPAVTYNPTSADILISDISVSVDTVVPLDSAPDDFTAANILLPSDTINRISVQTALRITLNIGDEPDLNGVTVSDDSTQEPDSADITLKGYPTDGAKTNLYAFIKPKNVTDEVVGQVDASDDITLDPEMYYYFPATLSGTNLSFTLHNPDAFFPASGVLASNDVIIAEAKTVPSGGGSSGCNAGFAGLLLLAAVPLVYLRGRK